MSLESLQKRIKKEKTFSSYGEIMLRLSPPGFERFFQSPSFGALFGGGEANVAVSLAIQGNRARFITAVPDNEIGTNALRFLAGFGVDISKVIKKKNSRMGIYFMEKGANQRPSRVIYDRDHSALCETGPGDINWPDALEGCGWFHITGITPALSKNSADITIEALKLAKESGIIISCDLNYRGKLWKYGVGAQDVMREIAGYADIIIANEEDCQKSLGIGTDINPESGIINESDYRKLVSELLDFYPELSIAAITLRESLSASHNRWGALISDRSDIYFSKKYDITDIVDRVGGGDSFSAGLIHGMANFSGMADILEYAIAASALTHSIEGDVNLSTEAEILDLCGGDTTGRIKR